MKILPYNIGSRSAKELARTLGCKRVRHDSPTFTNRCNHLIVNWGLGHDNTTYPVTRWLNHPVDVSSAGNKLLAFRIMTAAGVPTPEWTSSRNTAEDWDSAAVARYKLRGHSGDGIRIIEGGDSLYNYDEAPLYVKYIKKNAEYRYHVFNGAVIDVQMKRKRRETPNDEVNYQVRNHSNGWVYCRDDVNPIDSLSSMSISAVQALGLDFGAVDIIWNDHRQQGYVLEVNTACGLEGRTLDTYANAIRRYDSERLG